MISKRRLVLTLCAFTVAATVSGCGGRNIHRNLGQERDILQREWTLPTRDDFKPGNRAIEFSNPVIHENTIVFGNQRSGLVSLYPGMQRVRWVLPVPNGVTSDIAIERGAVFFVGGDGNFYSVDVETGRVNWRYDVHNVIGSRPTVSGGRVFVTTADDTVYAFDAGTGKWLWHYRRRTAQAATVREASSPLVDGSSVLVGLSDGYLVSLSLDEGQLQWERKLNDGLKFTDVDAHPVLDGGVLYVPSYDGSLYALRRDTGDVLWKVDAGGSRQVVIQGDRLFFPSSDGYVYALNKASGKTLWKFELDRGVPTRLVMTDKYVILGSSFQYLYALDKETGKGLYRFNAGWNSGFYGAPAYDSTSSRLYILSAYGNLYSFAVK